MIFYLFAKMYKKILLIIFIVPSIYAQTKLLSWNIQNLGKSKSQPSLEFIANTVKNYDIIAIQEVVAGYGGSQAVAQIIDKLNRKGAKWDYTISDPTTGSAYKCERYAFLWKTSKVKIKGKAWLEQKYKLEMDREPFFATFECHGKYFTVGNFHAITKNKQPETEIKYFKFIPNEYPTLNFIFVGDFNCPQSHTVFNPLRDMGFKSILKKQKTSLKNECKYGNCLASEFDNMYYDTKTINVDSCGVLLFYQNFDTLKEARVISDHIPIWGNIILK